MLLRHFLCLFSCVFVVSSAKADDAPWSLSGSITNTTNPKRAINGTATISFKDKDCLLRIDAPLVGSGVCHVSKADDKGNLVIESEGPAGNIVFEGTAVGNDYSGRYSVGYPNYKELPQQGTFQFHMD